MFAALALAVGTVGWWVRGAPRWLLAAVLVLGLVGAATGTVAGVDGYPWSNLLVLAVAVSGGVLLGQLIPPRAEPMLLVLVVLAALDAAQLLVAGGTEGEGAGSWFSLLVRGGGEILLQIGVADLVIVVALAIHGARRGLGFWPSILASPSGLLVALVYTSVIRPSGGLVLLPFLLLGWLLVESWVRVTLRHTA